MKTNLKWIQIEFVSHLIIFIVVPSRSALVSKRLIKLNPFICIQAFKPRQAVDKRNYTPRYGQVTKAERNLLRARDREAHRRGGKWGGKRARQRIAPPAGTQHLLQGKQKRVRFCGCLIHMSLPIYRKKHKYICTCTYLYVYEAFNTKA